MYIQITDRCNMKCAHCCFSCEPGKGSDMDRATFDAAIEMAQNYGAAITLGGGEPTLHPEFEYYLLEAIAASEEGIRPFIVTNGSVTKRALLLSKLSKADVIDAHLSTDNYHDGSMVDEEVYSAFGYNDWDCDKNGHGPIAVGRYAKTMMVPEENRCACEDWCVKPNGDIHQCGCPRSPIIGTVFDGIDEDCCDDYVECYKQEVMV